MPDFLIGGHIVDVKSNKRLRNAAPTSRRFRYLHDFGAWMLNFVSMRNPLFCRQTQARTKCAAYYRQNND
jgi:hypothetical protein